MIYQGFGSSPVALPILLGIYGETTIARLFESIVIKWTFTEQKWENRGQI